MSSPSFSLKKPPSSSALFMPTTNANNSDVRKGENVVCVSADKIRHYHKHPFKLYEGERLNDMVESIKDYGILSPLIVIPLPPDEQNGQHKYEVIIGHNRLESGKLAELTEVPCIIREGLTDEEVAVFVRISNLLQRGFSDLPHSERAEALALYYGTIKHQGRRTDLIKEVEALLCGDMADTSDSSQNTDDGTSTKTPPGKKSIDIAGEKYGLKRNSVARYIRLNGLIPGFKELLDTEELSIRAGVSLSYINDERQYTILSQMQRYEVCPSMKQAEQLRQLDTDICTSTENNSEMFLLGCVDILLGKGGYDKEQTPKKTINFKLDRLAVESYFSEDDTEETMQETILEALAFYHQHRDRLGNSQEP